MDADARRWMQTHILFKWFFLAIRPVLFLLTKAIFVLTARVNGRLALSTEGQFKTMYVYEKLCLCCT